MDAPPLKPVRKLPRLPVLVICLAAALIAAFWLRLQVKPNGDPFDTPIPRKVSKLTRDESLKLIDLRNQAIGDLENHEFSKADTALTEILSLMPDDPFAPRNLLICRQLALEAISKTQYPAEFAAATISAKNSVARSKTTEPQSFIPWTIAARIAAKLDQPEEARTDLHEAMRLSPDSVGPAYDLFTLLQTFPGESQDDEKINALRLVYEKEPRNLFVIKDWIPLLAQKHGPELVDALTEARQTIEPFVEAIKVNSRNDVGQILDTALKAAREGNWAVAQRSITMFKNLILPESARDKRFVSLDSLEYLLPDFREESLSNLNLPDTRLPVSRPVHFLPPDDLTKWPRTLGCREIVVTDFDLDDRPDLVVLQDNQIVAWGRKSDDQPWRVLASVETAGDFVGLLAFDFDDDVDQDLVNRLASQKAANALKHETAAIGLCHTADPDFVLFGSAGLKLFENQREAKSGTRTLIGKSGGTAFDDVREVTAAGVADFDSDGDLDLIIAAVGGVRVFSNRGNLTFDDITDRSLLPPASSVVTAFAIVDWDRDSDIDLLISTSNGGGLLENLRHGRLRYRELDDLSALRESTSLEIGDFDGDASWDVVAAGKHGTNIVITNRTPDGIVSVRKTISLVSTPVRTARVGDFDNDSGLDVLVLKDDGATIFRGDEKCSFSPNPRGVDDWLKKVNFLTVDDLDRDGDLDLVMAEDNGVISYSNQCRETDNPGNGWLEIQLLGELRRPNEQNWDKRVNHINLGGMIEVKSGQRYQAQVVTGQVAHFGLGVDRHADVARILWANGIPTDILDPVSDVSLCIEQKLLGSCPYLYTWNGERFEFVTDLLWNAPLGLKFAETVIAPWREWEYLKIDGQQLKADHDEYELRITAELWEAEYFDQIKLFAIDHPAGTDIFTNEKVGPAEIADPKIHTVRTARKPVAARDTKGRDVLSQVIARDGIYTKTFDKRLAHGFTEEHFLELDLGEFPEAKNVTLFLTGWMFPGSTSLRVQLSQNPDLPNSRPPSLYAPDAQGEWREVRPFMGFPGGKTKTIAVDVSDLFAGHDHRLRIVSNMELFWDAVFFTVDDEPVEIQQTELKLVRAELHDRGGVSFRSWPASGNGPDQFDYDRLIPGEQWPAMSGKLTRFGDVFPLLIARDDHLVVTGSGDEIRLSFAEPPSPLAAGFVRDFVIYTVGWDKDADLNTVYGDTVEPLPFEAMTVYAHRDGEPRPLDPEYVQYLNQYQTRRRNPSRFWRSVQQWKRDR